MAATSSPAPSLVISFKHPPPNGIIFPKHYQVQKKYVKLSCFQGYSRNQKSWIIHAKSAGHDDNDIDSSGSPSTSFLSVLCPLLKLFSGGDPSKERNYTLEVATSSLSSLARLPWGSKSLSNGLQDTDSITLDPPNRLQLFEFEACPFCRRVREAMTELDLSVEVLHDTERWSEDMVGKSCDIVNYLFQRFGQGRSPSLGLLESTLFTGWMPTLLRAGRGLALWEQARPEPPPEKLELFSYENNPYARIVREALCELELPYILHNVGKGSPRSKILLDKSGSTEVPYIIDPNTGVQTGDFKRILSYLFKTYAVNA